MSVAVAELAASLHQIMDSDPGLLVLGPDVGAYGGRFRATRGLFETYGASRVIDLDPTPVTLVGVAVGLSQADMTPVVELEGPASLAQAASIIASEPGVGRLVLRVPTITSARADALERVRGEGHAASFSAIEGAMVVCASAHSPPSRLLEAAAARDGVTVIIEPTGLYRTPLASSSATQLGTAQVVRDGADLTLMGWGETLEVLVAAAAALASDGVHAKVIDVRCLHPLDVVTLGKVVRDSGRALVAHAAGAEALAAQVAHAAQRESFLSLEAPIETLVVEPGRESVQAVVDAATRALHY